MKEQELRDIFHDYRPEIDDNDEFMARLTEQMDAEDARQQPSRTIPLYRRFLPWVAGIAACLAILIGSVTLLQNHPTIETDGIASVEGTEGSGKKAKDITKPEAKEDTKRPLQQEENTEFTDSVKMVKELLQMARPPKHYMAKQEKQTGNKTEPEPIDATDLAEQAIAEEEQRIAMLVMQQMSGSLQDDYLKMTREIRQRGERMNRQVEMAVNDDKY